MSIKITHASFSKGYYIGEYLQHKPGLECDITGDTTHEEALNELEKLLDAWHNSHLISNSQPTPNTEINLQFERLEIEIENAKSIEELKAIKQANPAMPVKLLSSYLARLQNFKQ